MAALVPMLGAVFAHAGAPKSEGRVRPKPKTTKGHRAGGRHRVTHGEKSVSQPHQQHGELASVAEPKPLSERMKMREHAKHEMRRATEDWVSGRMTTHEHKAVHARGKHILSGKHPHEFSGKSGERKIKGLH
jgi:hypothetical protein